MVICRVAKPGKCSCREERIYGGRDGGVDIRADLPPIVLLFDGDIVERLVLHNRAAQGKASPKAPKGRLALFCLERVPRIERAVLRENEGVSVNRVCPGTRDDVDRTARGSARLRRETVVDHLKFLHDFRRQFGSARTSKFVVVIEAVDGYVVAPSTKTTEREAAAAERR